MIIYLITLLKKWYNERHIRRLRIDISFKSADKYSEIFEKIIRKYKYKDKNDAEIKLHAIFYLMFILFIKNKKSEIRQDKESNK